MAANDDLMMGTALREGQSGGDLMESLGPKEVSDMKIPDQVSLLLKLYECQKNGNGYHDSLNTGDLENQLDPSIRRRYQKLKARNVSGIALLKNRTCSECRMVYPEAHELLRYENCVRHCEYCGRILVVLSESAPIQSAGREAWV